MKKRNFSVNGLIILLSSFFLINCSSKIGQPTAYASSSNIGQSIAIPMNASSCFCFYSDAMGKKALTYTNNFRKNHNKPALKWSQQLANFAKIHSQNMGNGVIPFGHNGFNCRVACLTTPARSAGENVFFTSRTGDIARQAVNAWIHSAPHRANLLGNYNHCGIGFFRNTIGLWYVTQIFALF